MKTEESEFLKEFVGDNDEALKKVISALDVFYTTVCEESKRTNIIGAHEIECFFERHVLDSIYFLKYVDVEKHARIVDLGSGAGLPCIPIKIIRDDLSIISIESNKKKADFQRTATKRLDFNNFTVLNERIENIARGELREQCSIVVTRALDEIAILAEYALPLLKVGGKAIFYKAFEIDEEVSRGIYVTELLGGKIEEIIEYITNRNIKRKLVIVRKIVETSDKWPRRAGMPKKRPIIKKQTTYSL